MNFSMEDQIQRFSSILTYFFHRKHDLILGNSDLCDYYLQTDSNEEINIVML